MKIEYKLKKGIEQLLKGANRKRLEFTKELFELKYSATPEKENFGTVVCTEIKEPNSLVVYVLGNDDMLNWNSRRIAMTYRLPTNWFGASVEYLPFLKEPKAY